MARRPTVLPPQGTPGIADFRNPTLIPNFDRNSVKGDGSTNNGISTVNHSSPAGFLAANPRAPAQATATIGGTFTLGDEVTLEMLNGVFPGGYISHTYTTVAGDTPTTVAEALADLFNDDPVAAGFDVEVDVAGSVLTFNQNGPIGNFTTLSAPLSEPSKITVGGTALTGDVLAVLFTGPQFGAGVLVTSNTTTSQNATTMALNLSNAINANAALTALGISSSPTAGVIALTVPAAAEPATVTAWVNTIAPTATIVGTAATGDTLNLTFTNVAIAGSPHTVTYVAVGGETATVLATALTALINADPVLIAAGVTATSALGVISYFYQQASGQIRFGESVSPGSETITITTTPTETIVVATKATETVVINNTPASVVATIVASAPMATDTVALTFTNAGVTGLPVTKTYTLVGADSATVIAAGLVALINGDTTLQDADIAATNLAGVITITQQGVIGNSTVVSAVVTETGGGTETVTFTPSNGHMGGGAGGSSGLLSGGTGPIFATNNFEFAPSNGGISAFLFGQPYELGYDVLTQMVAQGMPIT
jgi:hypothetical protein